MIISAWSLLKLQLNFCCFYYSGWKKKSLFLFEPVSFNNPQKDFGKCVGMIMSSHWSNRNHKTRIIFWVRHSSLIFSKLFQVNNVKLSITLQTNGNVSCLYFVPPPVSCLYVCPLTLIEWLACGVFFLFFFKFYLQIFTPWHRLFPGPLIKHWEISSLWTMAVRPAGRMDEEDLKA